MMKLTKSVLVITAVVVFLFGCRGQDHRNVPQNVKASETSEEIALEQTEKAKTSQDNQTQETVSELTEQVKPQEPFVEAHGSNAVSDENTEAQQKLMFAQRNLDLAQKGILSYSQAVALSRTIIADYPGTEYERKAREILRQVPMDLRDQYKLTEQELGLQNEQD